MTKEEAREAAAQKAMTGFSSHETAYSEFCKRNNGLGDWNSHKDGYESGHNDGFDAGHAHATAEMAERVERLRNALTAVKFLPTCNSEGIKVVVFTGERCETLANCDTYPKAEALAVGMRLAANELISEFNEATEATEERV